MGVIEMTGDVMHEEILEAIRNTVKDIAISMLLMEVRFTASRLYNETGFRPAQTDALVVVGLRGGIDGGVRLGGEMETLGILFSAFIGDSFHSLDDKMKDALGELTNIIAGGIQECLAPDYGNIDLTPPRVMSSNDDMDYSEYFNGVHQGLMLGNHRFFVEVFF